jgi:hypothetical protein
MRSVESATSLLIQPGWLCLVGDLRVSKLIRLLVKQPRPVLALWLCWSALIRFILSRRSSCLPSIGSGCGEARERLLRFNGLSHRERSLKLHRVLGEYVINVLLLQVLEFKFVSLFILDCLL